MPALPSDLTTITAVELILGLTSGSSSAEPRLYGLINGLSEYLTQEASRTFAVHYVDELRNGTGQNAMMVLEPPQVQLWAALVMGSPISIAAADTDSGLIWDEDQIAIRGTASLGGRAVFGAFYPFRFPAGKGSVRFQYTAGFALPNQTANDWQASQAYYPCSTIKPGSNNAGGFIFSYQGKPDTNSRLSGASRPTFNQTVGSVTADGTLKGGWTNLGITDMPDAVPLSWQQAAAEIVALRARQYTRWGDTGTGLGSEHVSYFMKNAQDGTNRLLQLMSIQYPVQR
jgi:hypothetical protein